MKQSAKKYKRIVVKIGSSLFCSPKDCVDFSFLNRTIDQLSALARSGREIVVVSSGAIALGMRILNLKSRPKDLPHLQAAASVGQNALMDAYSKVFKASKINCGQVLLTREDFTDRKRHWNAKNTLEKLLEFGCVPVINENDATSTEEIKFGDNDQLSALVAALVNADLLIMLSDVDGLWDKDKKVIKVIAEISSSVKSLASSTNKNTSVGGMITKLEAAKIAIDSGIPAIIANGRASGLITEIISDPASGGNWTLFLP